MWTIVQFFESEYVVCLQVDGILLSHPKVAEAVAFAAPDEKFGEVVAAAIVPSGDIGDKDAFIADVKKHAASKLAKFKVSNLQFPLLKASQEV